MSLRIFLLLVSLRAPDIDATEDYGHRIDRLSVIADAIASVAGNDAQLAAYLAEQAYEESRFSLESQMCQCRHYGCDHGRAHGPWNLHRVPSVTVAEWWSYCGTSFEAVRAGALRQRHYYDPSNLESSFRRCGGSNVPVDAKWPEHRARQARWFARVL